MNKENKKNRNKKTLLRAIRVVKYEIDGFNDAFDYLVEELQNGNRRLLNLYLENFLLHSRILYEFFYSNNPRKDDMIAEDFLINKKDFIINRTNKRDIDSVFNKRKADKMLVHITYYRLRIIPVLKRKQWRVDDIHKMINRTIEAFRNNIKLPLKSYI